MSRLDNCLTAIVGDRVPLETARKTFFFLVGIIVRNRSHPAYAKR